MCVYVFRLKKTEKTNSTNNIYSSGKGKPCDGKEQCSKSLHHSDHSMNKIQEELHYWSLCPKSYSLLRSLNQHIRVLAGKKKNPYCCSDCTKSFERPSQLKRHMRAHTGEKPYSCLQCPKSFAQESVLKRHERIHTGEKPYNCALCIKSFAHASALKRHKRIHNGEKPYSCALCVKSLHMQVF